MIDSVRVQTVPVSIGTVAVRRYKPDRMGHDGYRSRPQDMSGATPLKDGGAVALGRFVQRFGVNRS